MAICDKAPNIFQVFHVAHHCAKGVCGCYQEVNMSICGLSRNARVLYADLAKCVVCIGEASVGYNLGQHTLESGLLYLFLLLRCLIITTATIFVLASFTSIFTTAL